VNVEMLGQLDDRSIALDGSQATFALKAGEWFRRGRLFMVSPVHGDYRRCQAEIPLIVLSKFPDQLRLCWTALRKPDTDNSVGECSLTRIFVGDFR
jgi:hypothetical protein